MSLRVLLTPSSWLQQGRFCRAWDNKLIRLMGDHKFKIVDRHTAKLGEQEIWIENHPYASMTPYMTNARPKRRTILEARDKLIRDLLNP